MSATLHYSTQMPRWHKYRDALNKQTNYHYWINLTGKYKRIYRCSVSVPFVVVLWVWVFPCASFPAPIIPPMISRWRNDEPLCRRKDLLRSESETNEKTTTYSCLEVNLETGKTRKSGKLRVKQQHIFCETVSGMWTSEVVNEDVGDCCPYHALT